MLTPEFIEELTDKAEEIASQIGGEIIQGIINRVIIRLNRGEKKLLTGYDKWQIETLQEAGVLLEDIEKIIVKYVPRMKKEIKKQFRRAGIENSKYDDSIYKNAGISVKAVSASPELLRILQRGYNATNATWENLVKTTAGQAYQTFINACDNAYIQAETGAKSYTQAYADALNTVAQSGTEIVYPSGHRDTIETATLRCVRTGISQTCGEVTEERMKEYDWDIVLVSAHLGARIGSGKNDPSNHYWWQGKFYSRSGKDERFPPFSQTGYGSIEGLCGVNCRHSFGAGDGEHNPYEHFDSEENKIAYMRSQQQRAKERRIRKLKRECAAYNNALKNDIPDDVKADIEKKFSRKAQSLVKAQKDYREFCKTYKLRPLEERLKVAEYGYEDAKAVGNVANKEYQDWLKSIGAENTSLKTLDKYYDAEYNNSRESILLGGYSKAVKNGDISPLVGFEQYKLTDAAIRQNIVGTTTSNGVIIKDYTTHFIDRVIGQTSTPHPAMRQGVSVELCAEALEKGMPQPPYVRGNDIRQTFETDNAKVTISLNDMRVIQANPK